MNKKWEYLNKLEEKWKSSREENSIQSFRKRVHDQRIRKCDHKFQKQLMRERFQNV